MLHSSAKHLARGLSVRRAVRLLQQQRKNALLILPTTVGALHLTQALCARRSWRVTAGSVVAQKRWDLAPHLRTPGDIVKEFAAATGPVPPVISFPDQLAGEASSFVAIPFLGVNRCFCLLEAVLVIRHRPAVFCLRSRWPAGAFRLVEVRYDDLLPESSRQAAPVPLMRRLLSPLESELAKPPKDWLAAACFELKTPSAFERRIREELREIESLLRLALLASANEVGFRQSLAPTLASVTRRLRGPGPTPALH